MKNLTIGLMSLVFLTGCVGTTTIEEFDITTGKCIRKTTTKEPVMEQVAVSLKDKSVFIFDKGWWFGAEASIFSSDSPVPITRILAKRNNRGILTLHKDQQNIDKIGEIVKAALESNSISVSSTGVSETSNNK